MKSNKIFPIAVCAIIFSACGGNKNNPPSSSNVNVKVNKSDVSVETWETVNLPDNLVTTYKGDLSYTGDVIIAEEATTTATITKTGDSYTITFNNAKLPADKRTVIGVKFMEESPGSFASVAFNAKGSTWGDSNMSGITLENGELNVSLVSTNPLFTLGFVGTKQ